jgi:hypothetical protein
MSQVVSLSGARDDTWWAVVARIGRTNRVAAIFPTKGAAMADRAWREQQVRAYSGFLQRMRHPQPYYFVERMHRSELPRQWRPLPALGFLRGQFA